MTLVNVTVSRSPKIVDLIDKINHPEGTNATITCSVGSGELQGLTYEWYKEKEKISGQGNKVRIDIPADNYQSALRIFNLTQIDAALYTCIARNRFGQDKISTRLNVKGKLVTKLGYSFVYVCKTLMCYIDNNTH